VLFRSQPNAWIHLAAAAGVIAAGWITGLSVTEWLLLIFAIGLVFTAELANSAIEELVNLVSPGYHEKAKRCKDLAAAAVLAAAITAAVIGVIIFLPKFF
jgi:diacylglycerol kinase (ATP)